MSSNQSSAASPKPQGDNTTSKIAEALAKFLTQSTYACGGTVNISNNTDDNPGSTSATPVDVHSTTLPVTIRWDATKSVEKLTLPKSSDDSKDLNLIQALVQATEPASFGLKGKDVIDESYRKATKLDPSLFSTNFCPYGIGIIDVIGQTLLPRGGNSSQGIRAELYKLNVYQGPSGFFKPHVDTPRSELQFGSLVVSLPCYHEGGQLIVRQQGHSTVFDWSKNDKDIQWAAFYSDCEHEVLEVTSGHRITLTYNLFVRRGLGEMAGHCDTLDARQLPLFKHVKEVLFDSNFMPKGGLLGIYCHHSYAHATKEGAKALPAVLKGSDMIAFEVFRSLGVKVYVRPVIEHINSKLNLNSDDDDEFANKDHIGNKLGEVFNTYAEWGDYEGLPEVYSRYPCKLKEVKWLNSANKNNLNVQFGYTAYGNEAESAFAYSFCALLFKILPHADRVEAANGLGILA